MSAPSPSPDAARRNGRVAALVVGLVLTMGGASFAAVPLYRLFCQVTGFGGTPIVAEHAPSTRGERTLTVRFDANMSPDLDWSFAPETTSIQLRTGETATIFYKVTNRSQRTQTGMATFNVSPDVAGGYFNKISCFCFTEQTLGPGESLDMPVVFFLDPALEKDGTMKGVEGVTLSYTFIAVKSKAPVAASEAAGSKL